MSSRFIQDEVIYKDGQHTLSCIDCEQNAAFDALDYSWLKCNHCGSIRGYHIDDIKCTCDSTVFQITTDRIYCPNCGYDARLE